MLREMWLVRHGESAANVAASAAERAGAPIIEVAWRDADVPLSDLGRRQAEALGQRLADLVPAGAGVASSPYVRARETALAALGATSAHRDRAIATDERLRDRELGILDLHTSHGVRELFPQEEARRRWVGHYLYRPPGGESWADVALRLRSWLRDADDGGAERMLVVAHDAVVTLIVSVLLGLDEERTLALAREHPVPNASITTVRRTTDGWTVESFADAEHLRELGETVTTHPGRSDVDPH